MCFAFVTKLFVKTHHVMCVCMKKCSYNSASIVLLLERSSSKDRPQLENNKNFSQLLSWWRKTFGPWSTNLMSAATVVATNLGQRTMLLLLLGQTRLWWLHLTKLAWDSTVPWEPQKCCCPCLFVLLFFSFYLHSLGHCCKSQQRCSKKLSSLNLEFANLLKSRRSPGEEGVNLAAGCPT